MIEGALNALGESRDEIDRLHKINEDWMRYTIVTLREVEDLKDYVERLREENRSLAQTVRRVLRAAPVEER